MGGFREPRGAGWDYPAEEDEEDEHDEEREGEEEGASDDDDEHNDEDERDHLGPRGRRWESAAEADFAGDAAARMYAARLWREPGERGGR